MTPPTNPTNPTSLRRTTSSRPPARIVRPGDRKRCRRPGDDRPRPPRGRGRRPQGRPARPRGLLASAALSLSSAGRSLWAWAAGATRRHRCRPRPRRRARRRQRLARAVRLAAARRGLHVPISTPRTRSRRRSRDSRSWRLVQLPTQDRRRDRRLADYLSVGCWGPIRAGVRRLDYGSPHRTASCSGLAPEPRCTRRRMAGRRARPLEAAGDVVPGHPAHFPSGPHVAPILLQVHVHDPGCGSGTAPTTAVSTA